MPLVCRSCRRANPADALYCYHDGAALDTTAIGSGPIAVGSLRFRSPFVFPSGTECKSLDELVLACEASWTEACDLLRRGYLESFFASLGRTDLARAAHQAAGANDADRGLDEFLAKLPARTRQPAQLVVRPTEINLGRLGRDRDHHVLIDLANHGMGLIFGSIRGIDCDWLSVGDGSGVNRKMFQFRQEIHLPLRVIGRCLRAGNKPLEAQLQIESNAGSAVVVVRLEVLARPFPSGVLAGAVTPREVAVKAKAAVREAAGLFENGTVAAWYESNGWVYPVAGPPASGMGAVQQFFEALGLTRPPRVEVLTPTIEFQGRVGAVLGDEIRLQTVDKRPVFASCVSSASWLQVGKPILERQTARIPLTVEQVPALPGQRLQAQATVIANGNQRFTVEVNLRIAGSSNDRSRTPIPGELDRFHSNFPTALPAMSADLASGPLEVYPALPVAKVVALDDEPPQRPSSLSSRAPQSWEHVPEAEAVEESDLEEEDPPRRASFWPHLMPTLALLLCLLVTLGRDLIFGAAHHGMGYGLFDETLDPQPRLALEFMDKDSQVEISGGGGVKRTGQPGEQRTPVTWEANMRFGLTMLEGSQGQLGRKRLTYQPDGSTNSTVVRIDGIESTFGDHPWVGKNNLYLGEPVGHWKQLNTSIPDTLSSVQGRESEWIVDAPQIEISQRVMIVRGAQSRLLDTCLIRYRMTNNDHRPHKVGIRFLLDTFIGGNDGVPFLIPGAQAMCSTSMEFNIPAKIPQFIQACERENLADPGTVAQVGLKITGLEPPSRVTLGAYPDPHLRHLDQRCRQEKTGWEVPLLKIHTLDPGDSCVALYWNERELKPGETREVGFSYGLGNVSSAEGAGKLGLTVGGSFTPRGEFTVTAYVSNPVPNQTVTLKLPEDFELIEDKAQQKVLPLPPDGLSRNSPVTWKVRGPRAEGNYTLQVESSNGAAQTQPIRILTRGIFGE